jgi:type II secretory pathway pseudopilin PulG
MRFEVVLPVVTLIIGAALTMLAENLRDSRQVRRERMAREEMAAETRREAHAAFQRDTLIALQDALARYVRATGAVNYEDEMRIGRRASGVCTRSARAGIRSTSTRTSSSGNRRAGLRMPRFATWWRSFRLRRWKRSRLVVQRLQPPQWTAF